MFSYLCLVPWPALTRTALLELPRPLQLAEEGLVSGAVQGGPVTSWGTVELVQRDFTVRPHLSLSPDRPPHLPPEVAASPARSRGPRPATASCPSPAGPQSRSRSPPGRRRRRPPRWTPGLPGWLLGELNKNISPEISPEKPRVVHRATASVQLWGELMWR